MQNPADVEEQFNDFHKKGEVESDEDAEQAANLTEQARQSNHLLLHYHLDAEVGPANNERNEVVCEVLITNDAVQFRLRFLNTAGICSWARQSRGVLQDRVKDSGDVANLGKSISEGRGGGIGGARYSNAIISDGAVGGVMVRGQLERDVQSFLARRNQRLTL